jgi:hypothetical protein
MDQNPCDGLVKIECRACRATGLYSGFAEPKGTAVVCLRCGGSGSENLEYKPFTKRRLKRGIKTVSLSRGSFIVTGVGAHGSSITYAEFQKGKVPRL